MLSNVNEKHQKSPTQVFTTLYYNKLKSKITENCYRLMESKLTVGQKN